MRKWVRDAIIVAAAVAAANAPSQGQTAPVLNQPLRKELADYLVAHFQSPEDYVASKFKDHDLVFLGEAPAGGLVQCPISGMSRVPILHATALNSVKPLDGTHPRPAIRSTDALEIPYFYDRRPIVARYRNWRECCGFHDGERVASANVAGA